MMTMNVAMGNVRSNGNYETMIYIVVPRKSEVGSNVPLG